MQARGERCATCGGACADPEAELGPEDCQWLGNRLDRMDAARPEGAPPLQQLTTAELGWGDVEALQLAAFEAGEEAWWLVPRGPLWSDSGEGSSVEGLETGERPCGRG